MKTKLCHIYSCYGGTIMDNVIDRMTGRTGETAQRKAALAIVRAFAQDRYGPDVRVSWSGRLGCSCGCSPGWLVWSASAHGRPVPTNWDDSHVGTRQVGRYRQVPCSREFWLHGDVTGFSVTGHVGEDFTWRQ